MHNQEPKSNPESAEQASGGAVSDATPCSRLLEAQDIIRQLLNAVPTGHCADFYHGKKDQHGWHEPCPVEKRWRATTKRAEDFISSANDQAMASADTQTPPKETTL
jgi:hypothetical protein